MPAMLLVVDKEPDLERVAERVKARRLALGLSQVEAAAAGDVSGTTWRKVETYHQPVSGLSRSGVARGLRWQPDGIDRIIAGLDPLLEDDNRSPLYLPPVEPKELDVLRSMTRLANEAKDEEALKLAERLLAGVEPLFAELAGEWWLLNDDDRQILIALARVLQDHRRGPAPTPQP